MRKFRVKYTRLTSAGGRRLDPDLEFVETLELNADTPETAFEELQSSKTWMKVKSIEKLD